MISLLAFFIMLSCHLAFGLPWAWIWFIMFALEVAQHVVTGGKD